MTNYKDVPAFANHVDVFGLPVTKGGDGGDSCAEAGTVMALSPYQVNLSLYYVQGHLVRHPDASRWYGRPDRFSRDQLVALLSGLVMTSGFSLLKEQVYNEHKKKWFLTTWNKRHNYTYDSAEEQLRMAPHDNFRPEEKKPDFCGPETWALWLRVFPRWWKWPFLCLLDLETFLGSISWWFRKSRVTRNHLLAVYVSTKVYPTPTSWLARLICPTNELIERWRAHCEATEAVQTAPLFHSAFNGKGAVYGPS